MTITEWGQFQSLTCGKCGITFFVPSHWYNEKRDNGEGFTCPNGDSRIFRVSEADRLRDENAKSERTMQAQINREIHLRLVAEKALASETRKRRKIEKRVSNGVCPCCNRTFEDLARHMSTKHKDYALPPGQVKQISGVVQ